jgi:hypothetical protein
LQKGPLRNIVRRSPSTANQYSKAMPFELKFCFEFDPVINVDAWGESGRAKLHWFGLTSGRYWIETPVGEVLRYTQTRFLPFTVGRVAMWIIRLLECSRIFNSAFRPPWSQ